jgi:hypothetical protein
MCKQIGELSELNYKEKQLSIVRANEDGQISFSNLRIQKTKRI